MMYSYQHHIGDFIKDTANLTDAQLASYLRLIWMYYDKEVPLHDDPENLAFLTRSSSADVSQILKHYFELKDDGWHHKRCDDEIAAYRRRSESGKNGAAARWKNKPHMRPQCDRIADEQIIDSNREPRTENREKDIPPKPPKGGKAAVQLKTFLAQCEESGEKAISDYKPVFDFASRVGLPTGFVQTAWFEFKRQHGEGGVKEAKRQKDWRQTFRNYVEKNYLKLWWINPASGEYELTSQGRQAELANAER